ncbi:hypothetical protein J2802_004932 [Paraburkholderia caribensis]|nr:hypothetical protein [Paraburkholderia caribensis]
MSAGVMLLVLLAALLLVGLKVRIGPAHHPRNLAHTTASGRPIYTGGAPSCTSQV